MIKTISNDEFFEMIKQICFDGKTYEDIPPHLSELSEDKEGNIYTIPVGNTTKEEFVRDIVKERDEIIKVIFFFNCEIFDEDDEEEVTCLQLSRNEILYNDFKLDFDFKMLSIEDNVLKIKID